MLRYELTGESGPDHDKKFEVEVLLNGKPCGNGSGSSKNALNRPQPQLPSTRCSQEN